VSMQAPHLLFDVGDLAPIEKSEHKGIENREHMRSRALANAGRASSASAPSRRECKRFSMVKSLPMQSQQARGISLFGRQAGEAIHDCLCTSKGMFHTAA